jgi:prepilin-type N-terminal cleavage/methylation domain-containing protein
MKISRAYSLVELSVVILIVGVLVGGISEGGKLLKKSKLRAARSMTKSSYAAGVEDMILWLDVTAEGSMLNGATTPSRKVEDGNTIQTWDDVNPQITSKLSFTQGTDSARPLYEDNGINGLPSLYFNASADCTTGKKLDAPYSPVINTPEFTIFAVILTMEATTSLGMFIDNYTTGRGFELYKNTAADTHKLTMEIYSSAGVKYPKDTAALILNLPYIVTASRTSLVSNVYKNGNNVGTNTDTAAYLPPGTTATFRIGGYFNGGNYHYDGYISEIIMYGRVLADDERKEIEKYLGRKYGIKVS